MLDRDRPYFELSQNPDNIRWKQDGKFFYFNGTPVDEPEETSDLDLDSLTWREVKAMVIEAGGKWTSKAAGIKFLKG